MSITDWLAIIGAGAWSIPIYNTIKNKFIKSKIKIISDEQLEIGYTDVGPIINISFAFSAEKKDALIDKIELILTNENSEAHNFKWIWFEETLMQIDFPIGTIPYKKRDKAFALEVLIDNLTIKKIGFQKEGILKKRNNIMLQISDIKEEILKQNQDIQSLKTKEVYIKLMNLCKNEFIWKVGKYDISIKTYVKGIKEPFNHQIKFMLTDFDIKLLEKDIELLKGYIDNYYVAGNIKMDINYNWVYPFKID